MFALFRLNFGLFKVVIIFLHDKAGDNNLELVSYPGRNCCSIFGGQVAIFSRIFVKDFLCVKLTLRFKISGRGGGVSISTLLDNLLQQIALYYPKIMMIRGDCMELGFWRKVHYLYKNSVNIIYDHLYH